MRVLNSNDVGDDEAEYEGVRGRRERLRVLVLGRKSGKVICVSGRKIGKVICEAKGVYVQREYERNVNVVRNHLLLQSLGQATEPELAGGVGRVAVDSDLAGLG
ncbi:hypothetical protein TB2_023259 [Malus domestica]